MRTKRSFKELVDKSVMSVNNMGYDVAIVIFDDSSALTFNLRNTILKSQNGRTKINDINGAVVTNVEQNGNQIFLTFDEDIRVRADLRELVLI